MPRIKKKRVAISIDMTPLVDIAFLLLTFFMLTTQFKPIEEVEVTFPFSHSELKLPETNTMTLYVSKDSRLFLGFDSAIMMERMFGQANRLRQANEVKLDELGDLLIKARISNPKLITIVKSDAQSEYGTVSDVIDILQKVQITRFNMVTNFEVDKQS
ncbi:MAG: biopolymer transporter ExbD [Ignavibacteriae bacterium HGW-Ignavibacteriae-3]|nr:MAG: biopolymer transporter ExbD [Ignavibacteriae bacterium HGW-Ignavibacteriae-3]